MLPKLPKFVMIAAVSASSILYFARPFLGRDLEKQIWWVGGSILLAGFLFVFLYNKVTTGSFRRDRKI
jgi:hypothetical protein